MKKNYLLLLAVLVAGSATAQVKPQVGQAIDLFVPTNSVADIVPEITPSAAASGDTIWYDDFSDLSNWIVDTTAAAGTSELYWEYTTTGPSGPLTAGLGSVESATAANGWVIFDAEANGTLSPTGASTGVVFDSYIQMANPVDLSGINSVAVTFTEYYFEFQTAVYLEVSTDGSSWSTIQLHPGLQSNDQTATDAVQYRDISALAAGESTVWIRLRYEGGGVFWQVDDFMLVEGSSYDLEMLQVYNANIVTQYEYNAVPFSQLQELSITAISENDGGADMPNPVYNYNISNSSGTVVDSSFDASSNPLVSGALDTSYFATGFTPTEVDEYVITVSVSGDSLDTDLSNNEVSRTLYVTDSIYGHDDRDNLDFVISGGSSKPVYMYGNLYEIVTDVKLLGIQTVIYNFPPNFETTTQSVDYKVYELVPGDNTPIVDLTPIVEDIYDFQPGDVSSGQSLNFITIDIEDGDGVQLTAGNLYLVAVGNPNEGEGLTFIASAGNEDDACLRYGPYGQGGAVNWFSGVDNSPVIRMVLENLEVGIQENEDVADLSLYPNPTHGGLRITYTSKEDQEMTFNVFDVNGSLMLTQQAISNIGQKNTVEFDVSGLAAGMYLMQIQGANSTLTRRFVVN